MWLGTGRQALFEHQLGNSLRALCSTVVAHDASDGDRAFHEDEQLSGKSVRIGNPELLAELQRVIQQFLLVQLGNKTDGVLWIANFAGGVSALLDSVRNQSIQRTSRALSAAAATSSLVAK
ncbi:hypothetical protein AO263_16835 [Pseudomonas sp. NZIPFR-PS5]|nr:hypothetical protein AO263_16835 [Pseudomonas sp. NZIPFR-PS5]